MNLKHITVGASSLPAVILLHGFLGSGADWMAIAARLSDHFFCVMPDLPGHGRSMSPDAEQYTFESTARSIVAVADMQGLQKPALLGYSMGGRIALYTALQNPGLFSGLILESSSPGLKSDEERQQRIKEDDKRALRLKEIGVAAFVEEWYRMPLFDRMRKNDKQYSKFMARRQQLDTDGIALSLRGAGTGTQVPLWSRLPELSIPVLLVVGAEDSKFRDINREMTVSLRNCRLEEVPNAGHNVHFERQVLFGDLIREFIAKSVSVPRR
ncbi:MAG: 2-succinyl-6-hydroxy-2,4-cyclohexadiene-1-carboxylate synthase [Candidatus Zixiibacteriota bacterium]